jgi:hypothetical protein
MGASIAPVVQAGFMGVGKVTDMALDAARRLAGGRGGKAAEAEIQRLAGETSLTTDEIVQREIARMVADPNIAEIPATAAEIVMAAELPAPPSTELPVLPEA